MPIKMTNLHTLLIHELKDLYDAEQQLTQALPKMKKAAHNKELAAAFEEHLQQTRGHIKRLDDIFQTLNFKPGGQHCDGIEGLIEEGDEMIEEDAPQEVKDAGLICAAQRIEHYEMAGYGCARTFARMLDLGDVADTLQKTLDEEGETDEKLTRIAEESINRAAVHA